MTQPLDVKFEASDQAAWFDCPGCGDLVSICAKRHPSHQEWRDPFDGPWYEEDLPITCDSCNRTFLASWETHVDVTVEWIDELSGDAVTIAEGRY